MLKQIIIGSLLICSTVIITISFFAAASGMFDFANKRLQSGLKHLKMMIILSGAVLWMLAALSTAVWIWALAFLWVGEFQTLEAAVYFSIVSFTTLGFGDVIISQEWRLLSGMLAANGFLLFSLATAFLIDFLVRIQDGQEP
ncbi:Ion channel [Parasphingorhabdus marina DSM 22363]|uniref:Ion channel n=1 Tax=Parasphingorhabdus marina DSM 22363 TaxID=1123272 RepID=A0A1N6D133_9SPHN|nr:ion channel [Parasphingorhabdus marina]SIN64434.1 Ion channel [Parasphingorhabdus marina DSM 22363]